MCFSKNLCLFTAYISQCCHSVVSCCVKCTCGSSWVSYLFLWCCKWPWWLSLWTETIISALYMGEQIEQTLNCLRFLFESTVNVNNLSGFEIFVLLTPEIFLGGKCIKREIYALIIWEGSGTKFFLTSYVGKHLQWLLSKLGCTVDSIWLCSECHNAINVM